MHRHLVLFALVALALVTVSDAYAMGEIVQAASGLPVAAPVAFAALAALKRPRAIVQLRADASDPATVLASLRQAFEAYKAENDTKLKAKADVVVDEKVERINTALGDLQAAVDGLAIKLAAAQTSGAGADQIAADPAYAKLFATFFREGDGEREVRAEQFKGVRAAMEKGAPAKGGLLAPIEWDRTITDKLKIVSPVRSIAFIQPISGTSFTKNFNDRATSSGWVAEKAIRTLTGEPAFTQVQYDTGEIYAFPSATQDLLDDALIDVEAWLAGEVDTEFSYQEGIAFVSGDGVNKPKGFLTYTDAGSHPFGAIPTVNSGAAADITNDGIIDLVHDLPSERTPNARFAMNRKTQGRIRKLKDAQGRYMWEPSTQVGDPSTLQGFPISEIAAMPDVAANTIPIVFGDFGRGYMVVDRMGIRVLRDNLTNKPFVGFYTTKRVGGGVLDPSVLRYHKISA